MSEETKLQKAVLDYLAHRGIFAWRNNTGAIYRRGRLVKFGEVGSPDILGIMPNGRFLGIETKMPKGKLSPDQQSFQLRLRMRKGLVFTVRSLEELQERLEEVG